MFFFLTKPWYSDGKQMKYKLLVSHLFLIYFFLFQSVEGWKRWRLFGALVLTKGESGDCGMCVGFIPQLELCDGWENGKAKRRIDLLNQRKPL